MKRYNLILIGLLISSACFAQTEVTKYFNTPKGVEGVAYALPKNQIKVTVTAVCHKYTPGDFCQYADAYLRLKDVSPNPSVTWNLLSVDAEETAVPDTSKIFFIKMKKNTVAPLVQLSDKGIIEAINTSAIKQEKLTKKEITIPQETMLNPRDLLTEDVAQAGSTAKMAELISQEIFKLRDTRNSLLSGDVDNMPKDGASMQIMLNTINAQDKALTSMFAGTIHSELKTYTFYVEPQTGDNEQHVLFRFSTKLGVVDADDLSGTPINYKTEITTPIAPQPDNQKKNKKNEELEGVIYNVPAKSKFTVSDENGKTWFSSQYMIAQLGNTDVLLNDLFNSKKEIVKIQFDPLTGSLIKIDKN